jgi:hypothetical protein
MRTKNTNRFTPKKKPVTKQAAKSRRAKKAAAKPRSLNEILAPFIGIANDLPSDFAENHKLYASGTKKWK